jgi:DNA-binding NarL/FixJ family response regulator
MIRIMLGDVHKIVRRGMRELLEDREEWQVCGEAADGTQAIQIAEKLKPNIAVLDLLMPAMDGLDAIRRIRKVSPDTEILIFTMHTSEQLVRDAISAGARGFVLKCAEARNLIRAVEALANHRFCLYV